MPYFVRIGAIETNKSGVGSRGYQLIRRGATIIARWGAVRVLPGPRFFWISWREKRYPMYSESAAKSEYQRMVEKRIATYSKLPRGTRICLTNHL